MTTILMTWHELFDGVWENGSNGMGWDCIAWLGWMGILHSVVLGSSVQVMHLHIDARNDKINENTTRTRNINKFVRWGSFRFPGAFRLHVSISANDANR